MKDELSTALAQALSANRENLARYSALMDLCPLPAFFLDVTAKTPLYINPAYYELTGRTLDELQNPDWLQLVVHPDDWPSVQASWNAFTTEGTLFIHWHHYVNKNGHITRATAVLKRMGLDCFVGFVLPKCDYEFECPIAKMNKMSPSWR